MPRSRSILLIAHVAPPTAMSAARRAAGLTKYLERRGHRVTVLTSMMGGSGAVPGAVRTVRTRDLLVSPLNPRRAGFEALKGQSDAAPAAAPSPLASWLAPDLELVGWIPFALPRALGLARRGHLDCVITTSPPRSAHLIGLVLQRFGIAWVADFRDGWTFESQRPEWALQSLGVVDRAFERLVVRKADAVTAVTEPIARDLESRFERPVATITNGFDPDAAASALTDGASLLSVERRSLVHTGNLAYGGRSPEPLIAALRQLRESAPAAAAKLEVVMIGPAAASERAAVERADLGDAVRFAGAVPHEVAIAAQRAADGLLVITGPGQSGVATGKLFEYLSAGRPILVIGDDTAAADIVARTESGIAVARDNPVALATALRRFAEHPEELPRPNAGRMAAFAYPALAAQMEEQIEQAIVAATSGARRR